MAISEAEHQDAKARMAETRRGPVAIAARYDRQRRLIVVNLRNRVELAFPPDIAEGLAGAAPGAEPAIQNS